MDISSEPVCSSARKIMKTPLAFSSAVVEDSGYLSQGSGSPFNDSRSVNLSASNSHSIHLTNNFDSCLSEDASLSPCNRVSSMEVDDIPSKGTNFVEPQTCPSITVRNPSPEVWQSTPACKKLCVNVHKEFEFVTPLPGPSQYSSSQRHLCGHRHVDFLSCLAHHRVPVAKILGFLDPEDLCQVRLVSSSWLKLLKNFAPVEAVWREHVRVKHENKENSMLSAKPEEHQDLLVTPVSVRGQLRDIHNFAFALPKQTPRSPPVSPSKVHSLRYIKEGQKLKDGEKQCKCPKCGWPSVIDSNMKVVRCVGRQCGFHFCVVCNGPFHDGSPCPKATPVTPTKAHRVNKLSKRRRLRRLLL